jgi:hypothetical protein
LGNDLPLIEQGIKDLNEDNKNSFARNSKLYLVAERTMELGAVFHVLQHVGRAHWNVRHGGLRWKPFAARLAHPAGQWVVFGVLHGRFEILHQHL